LCFATGIALFSGSLYALTLTGKRRLGAVAPLGATFDAGERRLDSVHRVSFVFPVRCWCSCLF